MIDDASFGLTATFHIKVLERLNHIYCTYLGEEEGVKRSTLSSSFLIEYLMMADRRRSIYMNVWINGYFREKTKPMNNTVYTYRKINFARLRVIRVYEIMQIM